MITYANLKDGSINLYDLFVMNELIVYNQNKAIQVAREQERKKALKR